MDASAFAAAWSVAGITDDIYRTKFTTLPAIIADWTSAYGGLRGKTILDFGCGEATTALGIALQYGPQRVVGIDINADMDGCAPLAARQLGLRQIPDCFSLHRVVPGEVHDRADRFDVIYSWSVFEHVDQRLIDSTLVLLHSLLRPGGLLFIQIAPLYYSMDGSHLMTWVPEPWGHLLNQHNLYMEKLAADCSSHEMFLSLRSMFETLNRLTAEQLVVRASAAGYAILREHRTQREGDLPPALADVYRDGLLFDEQVVLLLQRR